MKYILTLSFFIAVASLLKAQTDTVYIEKQLARETFGDTQYGTGSSDNGSTRVQPTGWTDGTYYSWDWWEVTTFTIENGYITSGSDSSIRLITYLCGGTQSWENASGSVHCAIAPPDNYSGSWDTLVFNNIQIQDAKDIQVEFGLGKRGWNASPDIRGVNVEVRINDGDWVALDTSLIPNPIANDAWGYAELPLPDTLVGDSMDVRFACVKNQMALDDFTVMAMVPAITTTLYADNLLDSIDVTDDTADYKADLEIEWNEDTLFLNFTVIDDSIYISPDNVWTGDNIEFYIDVDNSKDASMGDDDFQFRLVNDSTWESMNSVGGVALTYKQDTNADGDTIGYSYEVIMPWDSIKSGFTPAVGDLIGFDILASDNDNGVGRNQFSWNSISGNLWNTPYYWGTLEFGEAGTFNTVLDKEAPSVPANFTAINSAANTIDFSWDASLDSTHVKYYILSLTGTPIDTVTGTSLTIDTIAPGSYYFNLAAVDIYDNVSNKANVDVTVVSSVEDVESLAINIYPNPVSDQLYINIDQAIESVEIIDITGKTVIQQSGNIKAINVAELSQGLYMIHVFANDQVHLSTFIKK